MICMKNLRFSSRPRIKVRRHGPPGSAKAQPCFYKKGSELGLILKVRQSAKIVVSDNPGLVDFAIGLVKSVFNLPDEQVMFFEEFELIQIQF